jgi:hypothetical protein
MIHMDKHELMHMAHYMQLGGGTKADEAITTMVATVAGTSQL